MYLRNDVDVVADVDVVVRWKESLVCRGDV